MAVAMANTTLHMPQKMKEYSFRLLKRKTDEFVKSQFMAPERKKMKAWLKEKLEEEYWGDVKYIVGTFRKSMPILSQRVSDGKRSTKGKKGLGRTFAAPSWVSADLGDSAQMLIMNNTVK